MAWRFWFGKKDNSAPAKQATPATADGKAPIPRAADAPAAPSAALVPAKRPTGMETVLHTMHGGLVASLQAQLTDFAGESVLLRELIPVIASYRQDFQSLLDGLAIPDDAKGTGKSAQREILNRMPQHFQKMERLLFSLNMADFWDNRSKIAALSKAKPTPPSAASIAFKEEMKRLLAEFQAHFDKFVDAYYFSDMNALLSAPLPANYADLEKRAENLNRTFGHILRWGSLAIIDHIHRDLTNIKTVFDGLDVIALEKQIAKLKDRFESCKRHFQSLKPAIKLLLPTEFENIDTELKDIAELFVPSLGDSKAVFEIINAQNIVGVLQKINRWFRHGIKQLDDNDPSNILTRNRAIVICATQLCTYYCEFIKVITGTATAESIDIAMQLQKILLEFHGLLEVIINTRRPETSAVCTTELLLTPEQISAFITHTCLQDFNKLETAYASFQTAMKRLYSMTPGKLEIEKKPTVAMEEVSLVKARDVATVKMLQPLAKISQEIRKEWEDNTHTKAVIYHDSAAIQAQLEKLQRCLLSVLTKLEFPKMDTAMLEVDAGMLQSTRTLPRDTFATVAAAMSTVVDIEQSFARDAGIGQEPDVENPMLIFFATINILPNYVGSLYVESIQREITKLNQRAVTKDSLAPLIASVAALRSKIQKCQDTTKNILHNARKLRDLADFSFDSIAVQLDRQIDDQFRTLQTSLEELQNKLNRGVPVPTRIPHLQDLYTQVKNAKATDVITMLTDAKLMEDLNFAIAKFKIYRDAVNANQVVAVEDRFTFNQANYLQMIFHFLISKEYDDKEMDVVASLKDSLIPKLKILNDCADQIMQNDGKDATWYLAEEAKGDPVPSEAYVITNLKLRTAFEAFPGRLTANATPTLGAKLTMNSALRTPAKTAPPTAAAAANSPAAPPLASVAPAGSGSIYVTNRVGSAD